MEEWVFISGTSSDRLTTEGLVTVAALVLTSDGMNTTATTIDRFRETRGVTFTRMLELTVDELGRADLETLFETLTSDQMSVRTHTFPLPDGGEGATDPEGYANHLMKDMTRIIGLGPTHTTVLPVGDGPHDAEDATTGQLSTSPMLQLTRMIADTIHDWATKPGDTDTERAFRLIVPHTRHKPGGIWFDTGDGPRKFTT